MNPERDRVIAVADVFGAPPARGELVPLLERFGRRAAAERGCRRYTFAASLSDADHFVFVGEWDSGEAMEAHYRSDGFREFQLDLHGMLSRASEMMIYTVAGEVRPLDSNPMDPRDAD